MAKLVILHLYPNEMNTYGDHGNVLTLSRRAAWHGYEPEVLYHHPGGKLPSDVDVIVGGGGQDSAQEDVQADILKIGEDLRQLSASTPMLMVCGTYQLLGHRFVTLAGKEIKGIGLFDLETVGGQKRFVGNIKLKTEFGTLYGFENHSGRTTLGPNQPAFGQVLKGNGNNGEDKSEGARLNDVFGTYLHGPILPNNPKFCDYLLERAATKRYGQFNGRPIDDSLAALANSQAQNRPY